MTIDQLSHNPHFGRYVKLMHQLHVLIRRGEDESEAGDELRDQMDYPWYQLDQEEREVAGNLSGDLYSIGEQRDSPLRQSVSEDLSKQVRQTHDREDWLELLRLVRAHADELPPAGVAFFRGVCWSHLKQSAIAAEFFTEATRLDPANAAFDVLRLRALIQAEKLELAAERALEIARDGGNWLQAVMAAQVLLLWSEHVPTSTETELLRESVRLAEQGIRLATCAEDSESGLVSLYQGKAHVVRSLAYERLEKPEDALAACNSALQLDPTNSDLLMIRAWLKRNDSPQDAQVDFRRGILRRGMLFCDESPLVLPEVAMSQ